MCKPRPLELRERVVGYPPAKLTVFKNRISRA